LDKIRTVHKRRPQSEGVVQCGHFAEKGDSSKSDVRTFWYKLWIFRNLWCVRTDKGGVSQCGQGRKRVNFSRTSFMDGS